MQITIDTAVPMSESDRGVLAALLGATNIELLAAALAATTPGQPALVPDPAPAAEGLGQALQRRAAEREAADKAAREVTIEEPAAQPEEKPRRTRRTKPKEEPVAEPEAPADARPVTDDAPATPSPKAAAKKADDKIDPRDIITVKDALAFATDQAAKGKQREIKTALAAIDARNVRGLSEDQVPDFINELLTQLGEN